MPRSSASKKSVVAGERDRPDVARRRAQWIKYQDRVEPERLVFIDETWTRTDMAALRGWAPRGQRLPTKVPHGRWKTMTFLAALRHDRIEAPWLSGGADRWREFPPLCREGPSSDASSRRYRNHGQSRQPPRQNRASAHPLRRSQALLPAKILTRPESYRTGLCQAQAFPPKSCRPNGRSRLPRNRRDAAALHTQRMRKLLRKLRIRTNLTSSCSSD